MDVETLPHPALGIPADVTVEGSRANHPVLPPSSDINIINRRQQNGKRRWSCVLSHSQSALRSLQNVHSTNPIVAETLALVWFLRMRNTTVKLLDTTRTNNARNDGADALATEAGTTRNMRKVKLRQNRPKRGVLVRLGPPIHRVTTRVTRKDLPLEYRLRYIAF